MWKLMIFGQLNYTVICEACYTNNLRYRDQNPDRIGESDTAYVYMDH